MDKKDAPTCFTLLFADPGAREFLLCNSHEDHEWFNRERFHMLLNWLVRIEAISAAVAAKPKQLAAGLALLGRESNRLLSAAEAAGYRVDRFLALLKPSASP